MTLINALALYHRHRPIRGQLRLWLTNQRPANAANSARALINLKIGNKSTVSFTVSNKTLSKLKTTAFDEFLSSARKKDFYAGIIIVTSGVIARLRELESCVTVEVI